MPTALRESPHFQTLTVALDALLVEADCADAPALCVDDKVGDVLPAAGGLQLRDAVDLKYEVVRQSRRVQSRQDIRLSNSLRAPLRDLNSPDYPPLISETLELQFHWSLLRLSIKMSDRSCWRL